jgi:hypothetical protein
MSSTTGQSTGGELDIFETPAWCVDALLQYVPFPRPRGERILDVGCGAGAILTRLHEKGIPLNHIAATDIRPQPHLQHPDLLTYWGDFLWFEGFGNGYISDAIANPPYGGRANTAMKFVQRMLFLVPTGGLVCVLLRQGWKAGGEVRHGRSTWLRAHMPYLIVGMDRRPSFDGKGTDSSEYEWLCWEKGNYPERSEYVLASCRETP